MSPTPHLPALHFELWVSEIRNRAQLKKATRAAYRSARRITRQAGGSGPWVYLVDPDPAEVKTTRLRGTLGVNSHEDLWVELVHYPGRRVMQGVIRQIWKDEGFRKNARKMESLVSRRIQGYNGTVAYLTLQRI